MFEKSLMFFTVKYFAAVLEKRRKRFFFFKKDHSGTSESIKPVCLIMWFENGIRLVD